MITLFILGAFIGSGTIMIVELSAQNKELREQLKDLEKKEVIKNE